LAPTSLHRRPALCRPRSFQNLNPKLSLEDKRGYILKPGLIQNGRSLAEETFPVEQDCAGRNEYQYQAIHETYGQFRTLLHEIPLEKRESLILRGKRKMPLDDHPAAFPFLEDTCPAGVLSVCGPALSLVADRLS